jgi:hypothetical protein
MIFKTQEIEQFVKDHIQSKIDHNELGLIGFDMENTENFQREFTIYENALFVGICNGILLCNGEIEGIE